MHTHDQDGAPSKRQLLLQLLDQGMVMVHLDTRCPEVDVPPAHREDTHLRLNLSYRFNLPVLEIGDQAIEATLSFGGQPYHCTLPWESIFGMHSHATGQIYFWPEDAPLELLEAAGLTPAPSPLATDPVPERPELHPVASAAPPRTSAPRRGHLRVVK